jgi:hypothetical protein
MASQTGHSSLVGRFDPSGLPVYSDAECQTRRYIELYRRGGGLSVLLPCLVDTVYLGKVLGSVEVRFLFTADATYRHLLFLNKIKNKNNLCMSVHAREKQPWRPSLGLRGIFRYSSCE